MKAQIKFYRCSLGMGNAGLPAEQRTTDVEVVRCAQRPSVHTAIRCIRLRYLKRFYAFAPLSSKLYLLPQANFREDGLM